MPGHKTKRLYIQEEQEYQFLPQRLRKQLLTANSPFAAAEAYKAARTNLIFTRQGEGCQKVAFTSTFSHEGKSISCINTAITLAANGERVLIIDADMRKPVINETLDIHSQNGLSEILAGLVTKDASSGIIAHTQYDNLFVLPSGHTPPNPAELLASKRMQMLLKMLEDSFDYILIDTPPLSMVTDAAVLIPNIHGYVLVVRYGVTPMDDLRNTVARLEQLKANILGFLLNDSPGKTGSYRYKRRHYSSYAYSYSKYSRSSATLPAETK